MEKQPETSSHKPMDTSIDREFYYDMIREMDFDLAKVKTKLVMVNELRIAAAELEVETAALFYHELFDEMEKLKKLLKNDTDTGGQ